ncbi:MAG: type II secretion system protein [Candidatus Doudnabacteria bacterium]|nr:type II secretion system protein [Candidatus Doudnabacteria bacterium]
MKQKFNQSGFTLLELLVVIAIIGLLASVVTLALQSARAKARDTKRAADVRQLVTSMEQYRITHGQYPTGTGSMASVGSGVALDDPTAMDGGPEPFVPNYIPLIPTSPKPADGDCGATTGIGGNDYWYESSDDGTAYTITYCIGKDVGSLGPGVHSATPGGIQ